MWLQGMAQATFFNLKLVPIYDGKPFSVSEPFQPNDSNHLQLSVLRFYISNIRLMYNGRVVLAEPNSYHLVDAAASKPFELAIAGAEKLVFDRICFDLGIDSVTNISGVKGGDLDPTKGMYWSWQSGYVNFKLEGRSDVCPSRNQTFQFHLGGYLPPYQCLQTVTLPVSHPNSLLIQLDIQSVLSHLNLAKEYQIMSPSAEGVRIATIVANAFKVSEK
jgi:hypothetical protein